YIFLNDVIHQPSTEPGFPINKSYDVGRNFTVVQDTAMDQSIVTNAAYSADLMAGLTDIPTLSIVAKTTDIWGATGFMDGAADRPGSVELIDSANPANDFQVDCAIDLHSHLRLKQSLNLKFKSGFGPSTL